jgi:alpha-tubulin suppressor-like RCC1 family protein
MAWGSNDRGQVGNGTITTSGCFCVSSPASVSGVSSAAQVSGGGETALALLADGSVVGWGDDFFGQIGDGGSVESLVPIPASKLPHDIVAVDVGGSHSLALLADGTVLGWGDDAAGQLGVPPGGLETCFLDSCRRTPEPVPGLSGVVAISTSESSNLALLANGTVMAWGDDSYGQVGDGTGIASGCRCVPTPVAVPGVTGAVAISSGTEGGAALLADGSVRDWGTDIEGQIGNGTIATGGCYCVGPTAVSGLTGVKALAGGNRFRLALLADGLLRGWGANNVGQLGQGSTSESVTVPAPAAPSTSARAVSGGSYHALALLDSGAVSSWGYNSSGQVGDGTTSERDAPQTISGISGASSVAGHGETSYALLGPSQTLTVALAGAGSGSIGANGLLCPGVCVARFPQSQTEILRAEPAPGNGFAGFSGPCTGTGPCQTRLDADQTVTATFGVPTGTVISRATIVAKKKKAGFSFAAPGAITGFECKLIGPPKKKGRKKRAKPKFANCAPGRTYKHLGPGRYRFEVRARDILGVDAKPARKKFSIRTKSRRPAS